jgi:hypothetical protein
VPEAEGGGAEAVRLFTERGIERLHSPVLASISKSAASAIKQGQFLGFTARGGKFDLDTAVRFALGEKETPPAGGPPTAS